jgi:hypothetical protein
MLRFTACDCGIQYLVRIDRDAWMRAWQTRRHYYCAKCKSRQLLPRNALVSWWMPRESAQVPRPPRAPSPSVTS